LFAQAKRIHALVPYTILKNVIRIANPAAVMSGVLDLFLAQPFGSRSLLQRIFAMAIHDGIRSFQKAIDGLAAKVDDPVLVEKLKSFTEAEESVKDELRDEAKQDDVDIVVVILQSELLGSELTSEQTGKVFNSYVAWDNAVENVRCYSFFSLPAKLTRNRLQVDVEMQQGAQWFAYLKQLLKMLTRQRDKMMMLNIIEEVTA
jgi:hypothetical protein